MSQVYISGPITNSEESIYNFSEAEKKLVETGHMVVSPLDMKKVLKLRKGGEPRSEELTKYCIEKLLECDSVFFIDTNEKTEQSILERKIAMGCGIPEIEVLYVRRY